MEARHYVASAPRSRTVCSVKRVFSEQSSLASFPFPAPASTHFYCDLTSASKQTGKARQEAQARLSNSSTGGGSSLSRQNEEEGNVLQDIATLFCSCEQLKVMVDSSLNLGVGPDMRNRIDHLLERIGMLRQSAERAARGAGGRVPSQLVASLKGLQREHSSLENIIRLATEAGPVVAEMDSNDQDEYSLVMAAQKGTLSMRYGADSVDVELAEGQKNETSVEVLSGPKYVMSTPPSENLSKLAAVRAEIERRVMEQLVKKQVSQPIVCSGQDFAQRDESKLTTFQKVPSVNGQKILEGKSGVDTAMPAGKGFLPQIVEARQLDQSPMLDPFYNKQSPELKAKQLEMENARIASLELHDQMVSKFEKDLLNLREQLSQVTEDIKQKEDKLVAVNEKLVSEQSKLSEKINELSTEITRRATAEDLNRALEKALKEMEKALEGTQNQVVSLGFELEQKNRVLAVFQEEQERTKQELQAGILSLKDKLSHIEKMYEGFNPQSIIVDLGSVKATLSALQKDQTHVQAQMVDWQEKVGALERSVGSNDKQIKELTSEVDSKVRKGEVNDALKKVMDAVEKQNEQLWNRMDLIGFEHGKNEAIVGLLQEDWKTYREELQGHIEAVKSKLISFERAQNDLNVEGVLTELSNIKKELTAVQEEQKHEQALTQNTQQQMVVLEGKGSDLLKRMSEEAERQRQVLIGEVRTSLEEDVLTELSNIKNKLTILQEEQKHERALILEAQQQMAVLEGKGSDLLKRMSEEAEMQKRILMDGVRTSVQEDVLTELSNMKNELTNLQEEQKHEKDLIRETRQQMVVLEGKGSDLLKRMSEEAERQRQFLIDEIRTSVEEDLLTELSNIKNKLTILQEEQKHEQALILEAQQQMAVLEGKGSDLLKIMSEEAETQRRVLMDEVRTSVEGLIKASHVSPGNGMEDALSIQESDAMKIDVRHLGNLVNDFGIGTSSSELDANLLTDEQQEITSQEGIQQMPDKKTASLEAFFSVMGQLIREELKRMDGIATQTLPLSDLQKSGEPTQSHVHGSGGTRKDGEDQGQNIIRLLYYSSWNTAFVHCCADKFGWTEAPGIPMQEASNPKGKPWKELRIKAARLEFVVTDGQGNWDRAPNGCNYVLDKAGVFELSAGVLRPASIV